MANKATKQTLKLAENARVVLERRYLVKDENGNVIETPEQLFRRVAENIAQAEGTPPPNPLHAGGEGQPGAPGAVLDSRPSTGSGRTDSEEARSEPSGSPSPRKERGPGGEDIPWADRFYDLMTSLRFLPNSPTLGNAGRPLQQLSACFVLPVEDSMESIFEAVKQTALIHQSGGGTGFAFSRLRPAGDVVRSSGGVASGPVSFMRVFDAATEAIKQGGTRRGANMAILDVHHPDIEAFIALKGDMVTLTNFNISVAADEAFMRAVEHDTEYDLINPRTGEVVGTRRARAVFDMIVANAWRNGDPGLVFLDRINADNPTPAIGAMEATNPCGEQPLLPYESCNLGSLNLSLFVKEQGTRNKEKDTASRDGRKQQTASASVRPEALEGRGALAPDAASDETPGSPSPRKERGPGGEDAPQVDRDALAEMIPVAVRFLDNVIDMNAYPVEAIDRQTKLTRKIGLGVMGWADMLFKLGIPYDSEEALELADQVMAFIREHADAASEALAVERGTFPAWEESIYGPRSARGERRLRNSTRTTVAPTGTLSIIADCTGGIEPAFALAYTRQHFLDPKNPTVPVRLTELNKTFEAVARERGFYSEELVEHLAAGGSLGDWPDVPEDVRRRFVTAHDIAPQWHVRMQAAFQRYTDNAVSKTINFPREATIADVAEAYRLAYQEGCKGITIYRDGSRIGQVLSHIADGEGVPSETALETLVAADGIAATGVTQAEAAGVASSSAQGLSLLPPSPESRPRRRTGDGPGHRRSRYMPPRPALPFSEVATAAACPDCANQLVFAEGCLTCRACGYTKCG